ncbi:MAG: DNA repair protein [Clostridia bacterium]|nr:DNA repair protein [Clostridia bacterium]
MENRLYLCIDLKSFYASVECAKRGLDPMTARLVVADAERTDKTICLAVTPALKALGVKNRCRLFEISKDISFLIAPPRMQLYIDYSAKIYGIYLEYFSKEDIYVYSVDEAFMDMTYYQRIYGTSPQELAKEILGKIHDRLGIYAACGIGTNLYLAKVALDITAKNSPDFIGYLDEERYRETLWDHQPLTDFWRIGKGIAARLAECCVFTMRDITEVNEELLYRRFGVDAELLIDHAWGREPITIADIKAYTPKQKSLTGGQVLSRDYRFEEAELILKEMTDRMSLELTEKGLVTDSLTLQIGYANSLQQKPAHGTVKLPIKTSSEKIMIAAAVKLFREIVDARLPIRRIFVNCNRVEQDVCTQMDLFADAEREQALQQLRNSVLSVKQRYGKNAVFKAMSLQKAATARQRNRQIGGHRSGE